MSNLYIQAQTLTDIADAIREKAGTSATMTPSQMASAIGSISGGDTTLEDGLITRTLSSYENSRVRYVRSYAFCLYSTLTAVSFPNVTSIGKYTFDYCASLATISFPSATDIRGYAFANCTALTTISFPSATYIESSAFQSCYNLLSLYLLGSSIPTLASTNAFISTPISNYTKSTGGVYGSIYIPASLYSSYITATNWATYSSRFVSV